MATMVNMADIALAVKQSIPSEHKCGKLAMVVVIALYTDSAGRPTVHCGKCAPTGHDGRASRARHVGCTANGG